MPRKKKAVSIYSIAKSLSISPSTVSKALGDYPEISEDVRIMVRNFAKNLNFRPAHVRKKSKNICLLMQRETYEKLNFIPFVGLLMEGVSNYAWQNGLEMSIFGGTIDYLNSCNIVRELLVRNADGVIIVNATTESSYIKDLKAQGFPHICICSTDGKPDTPTAFSNDYEIGTQAFEHFVTRNHKNIGIIHSYLSNAGVQRRVDGFKAAYKKFGIPYSPDFEVAMKNTFSNNYELGYKSMEKLLSKNKNITAVFAVSQNMAIGAMNYLQKHNYSIPKDISLMACDDNDLADYMLPPITSIHIPLRRLAAEAASFLHRKFEGEELDMLQRVPWMDGQLALRGSTAALKK